MHLTWHMTFNVTQLCQNTQHKSNIHHFLKYIELEQVGAFSNSWESCLMRTFYAFYQCI